MTKLPLRKIVVVTSTKGRTAGLLFSHIHLALLEKNIGGNKENEII